MVCSRNDLAGGREPATWALLLGFTVVGGAIRRRRATKMRLATA
jgi:hypothetical protein